MTDPIADYLTRLRNAIKANHRVVEVPASNLKKEITKILFEQGYILNYKFVEGETPAGIIKIALKYDNVDKVNAIKGLKRVSRPGEGKRTILPVPHEQLLEKPRGVCRKALENGAFRIEGADRNKRGGRLLVPERAFPGGKGRASWQSLPGRRV